MLKQKKIALIIGALILLILAGVAFMKLGAKSTNQTSNSTTTENNNESGNSAVEGTIKSLFTSGKNQTCSISDFGDATGAKGVVYISGKNMRGDFSIQQNGAPVSSHIIQSGDYAYFWSNAEAKGMKMKINLADATANQATSQNQAAADLDKKVKLNCVPWTVDNSLFTPPSNIEFTDFSSMMDSTKAQTTGTLQGSPCDSIEDPTTKASCIKALSGQQ